MDNNKTHPLYTTLHNWSSVLRKMKSFSRSERRKKSNDIAIVNNEEGKPIKWIKISGFTLLEILMVFVILGALSATTIFVAGKYQEQAIGGEAIVMMKQLLDGEIMHFIENDTYFPRDENLLLTAEGQEEVRLRISDALKLKIPEERNMDFTIGATETECVITIRYMIKHNIPCSITGHLNESGESFIIGG